MSPNDGQFQGGPNDDPPFHDPDHFDDAYEGSEGSKAWQEALDIYEAELFRVKGEK